MVPDTVSRYDRLLINARLATLDPVVGPGYGLLERHALRVGAGRIAAMVPMHLDEAGVRALGEAGTAAAPPAPWDGATGWARSRWARKRIC